MIYFAINSNDGLIKIGYSAIPIGRIIHLGKSISILATLDGNRPREILLHKRFSHLRVTGEWFKPDQELLNFIQNPDLESLKEFAYPTRKARKLAKERRDSVG